MSYTVRRDLYGYAAAIERDGYTVLQLNPGTTRNEEEIEGIIKQLNVLTELEQEIEKRKNTHREMYRKYCKGNVISVCKKEILKKAWKEDESILTLIRSKKGGA